MSTDKTVSITAFVVLFVGFFTTIQLYILAQNDTNTNYINKLQNTTIAATMNDTEMLVTPSTWEELNKQQFCRIEQSDSYSKQIRYLKFLYKLQFPVDCLSNDQKFLIYDINLEKGSGLGASLFGNMLRYFTASLILNRTFLLNGTFDWSELAPYCNGKNAMECYFLPLSNCNPLNIFSNINKSDPNIYYQGDGFGPYGNGLVTKCNNSYCIKQKVIYVNKHSKARPVMYRRITRFCRSHWDINWGEYAALSISFMLRPQPNVRKIVFDKINKSIYKSMGVNRFEINSSKTISLGIRASDKCKNIHTITGKKYTHGAEIDCFTPIEYVYLMNSIEYLTNKIDNKIENIILTSEDSSFVNDVIKFMKNKTYSNVTDWNIILNTEDYSVGEGTTTFQKTVKKFGKQFETFSKPKEEIFTSFYTDHIISAISSLILQIHLDSEYFIVLTSSSWSSLMWNWLRYLNCNINNPNKHKYIKNKKCISLVVPGYQTHGLTYKYIKLSKDLWQQIHNEDLNPSKFYDKFNIKIGNDGWDKTCG